MYVTVVENATYNWGAPRVNQAGPSQEPSRLRPPRQHFFAGGAVNGFNMF